MTGHQERRDADAGTPIRLVISGATGRMGRTIASLAAGNPHFELSSGLDRQAIPASEGDFPILTIDGADAALRSANVVIDFSAPAFLRTLLEQRLDSFDRAALVVGTTGLSADEERLLARAAERIPVLSAANFSIGVNLVLALAERAAGALGPGYDIEIVETHHRRKEDAPSGTALALGEAVAAGRGIALTDHRQDGRSGRPGPRPPGEIGFHALRGGDVIGDHTVHFISDLERIELTHRASDRALFAAGALRAAEWLVTRAAGRYSMRDLLGF